jgi:hypothetical protein
MDRYVEDGSMEDNLEPYVSHNGTNPRAAGSHCISSGKGLWHILSICLVIHQPNNELCTFL